MEKEISLQIKGMVCQRCVWVVEDQLKAAGHVPVKVSLGEASVQTGEKAVNIPALQERLAPLGFSLLEDRKLILVNEIKALVEEVYSGSFDFPEPFNFAKLATERLNRDYAHLSDVFIEQEKQTIEQYIIAFRINKVKECLVYSDATLSDIAFNLHFSSVAHLSAQFKQHTGLAP